MVNIGIELSMNHGFYSKLLDYQRLQHGYRVWDYIRYIQISIESTERGLVLRRMGIIRWMEEILHHLLDG